MKEINLEQNTPEWLEARRGKITGSRLKDIVVKRGTGKKIGYYEIIAESIGIPATDESAMDRGHRLEDEALQEFTKLTGKKVKKAGMWVRDDNDRIAISPDGVISATEAIEVKCLSSAKHIQAVLTNEIPDDYEFQKLQYFIVNDKLKKLYFTFYDPRITARPLFIIEVNRKDIEQDIETYLEYQKNIIREIEEDIIKLTF